MRKVDELREGCIAKAGDQEMCFTLLSRDAAAPGAINAWIAERIALGLNAVDDPQIIEAKACAQTMILEGKLHKPQSPTPEAQPVLPTREAALLPCPFCGSQPLIEILGGPKSSHRTVNCSNKNCGCDLHFYPTEEAAIAAWNKRV